MEQRARDLFAKLEMEHPAVAIKFHYAKPAGVAHAGEKLSLCQYVNKAQRSGERFYITKEDEDCLGSVILGMEPKPPLVASGVAGMDFEVYRTPAPNARLHATYPTLTPGAVNFVEFCPVAICDFYPDLIICVANTRQADILMRATSYISGDLWESKTSCVMSCAWTYAYPYLSGKVNFCITGMHHGMKRRKVYPEGLHIIAIPYQKIDEVVQALDEMPWVPIAFREDEESRAELKRRMDSWERLEPDFTLKRTD